MAVAKKSKTKKSTTKKASTAKKKSTTKKTSVAKKKAASKTQKTTAKKATATKKSATPKNGSKPAAKTARASKAALTLEAKNLELSAQLRSLTKDLEGLRGELLHERKDRLSYEASYKKQANELAELREQLIQKADYASDLETAIRRETDKSTVLGEKSKMYDALEGKYNHLEQRLHKAKAEATEAKKRSTAAEKELKHMREAVETARNEIHSMADNVSDTEEALADFHTKLEEAELGLQRERDRADRAVESLANQGSQWKSERGDLDTKLRGVEARGNRLASMVEEQDKKLRSLRDELLRAERRTKEKSAALDEAEARIAELEDTLDAERSKGFFKRVFGGRG
jgi:RNA polymerase primary sigma factor